MATKLILLAVLVVSGYAQPSQNCCSGVCCQNNGALSCITTANQCFSGTKYTAGGKCGAGGNSFWCSKNPQPVRPTVRPTSQTSLLVAHGFAVDDVAHGPVWTETSGVGRFALDAERHRVLATIPFVKLLLLEDVVYVYNAKTPAALGPNCRKYLGGAVRTGAHVPGVHPVLSYLDQYMCQWIQPSPCSWASVVNFYDNLQHTARVSQGPSMIDVFWTSFNISVESKLPFASSIPKTVELQYDADGVLTHLSHWTSNQRAPPFSQDADISHSDDNVWNITRDVSDPRLWAPDPSWNCTVVS